VKEICWHREAGLVDLNAVVAEQLQIQEVVAPYPPDKCFNGDETVLFGLVAPKHGLATKAMSGKTKSKNQLTMMLTCNATGTQKLLSFFIGKWKKPCCFAKPIEMYGFWYCNNKKAWMTAVLFEEYKTVTALSRDWTLRLQNKR
jgi:hypothetical protein